MPEKEYYTSKYISIAPTNAVIGCMEYIIYQIVNNINGKSYIGKTKRNRLKRRLVEHRNKQSYCTYIARAIQKYGFENFTVNILAESNSHEEICEKECSIIKDLNTLVPNGYNLINENWSSRIFHEETRKKMSRNFQGRIINKKEQSQFIGVRRGRTKETWCARITQSNETLCKTFKTEVAAAEAYDRWALYLFGGNARVNFPNKASEFLKEDLKVFFENSKPKAPTSKYKNVSYHKLVKKWFAYFYEKDGNRQKSTHIKWFLNEEDAAKALDKVNIFLKLGKPLNFPEVDYSKDNLEEFYNKHCK